MSLRPALFDLWPSPWPEDCKHVWDIQHLVWGDPVMCRCRVCGVDAVGKGWPPQVVSPGTVVELNRRRTHPEKLPQNAKNSSARKSPAGVPFRRPPQQNRGAVTTFIVTT